MSTRTMQVRSILALAGALVVFASHADAAPTAAGKCAASKLKGSGKAVQSRTGCEANGLKAGEATDSLCVASADSALAATFANAEAKGGCESSSGQADDAQAAVDSCIDSFVVAITGDGSCAAAKMKAVGKNVSADLKCWQKGFLSGADADGECLSKAALKLGAAVGKADARGTCTGTTAALAALVDACVESLLAPGSTTTTVPEPTTTTLPGTTTTTLPETTTTLPEPTTTTLPETTTTTLPDTTTTTLPDTTTTTLPEVTTTTLPDPTTTTTSTTITTTTTDTTTTTTIDIGPVGWTFCAHAGETCTLPRHDLPISMQGFPPATPYVTVIDGLSVECTAGQLFPGMPIVNGDCYYLNAGCDYEMAPFGVAVIGDMYLDPSSTVDLQSPPLHPVCGFGGDCTFATAISADLVNHLSVFVVDPRVCDVDDRAHLRYHWSVRYPPGANNNQALFVPMGISGFFEPTLTFSEQTMPTLDGIGGYRAWFARVDITQELHEDFPLSTSEVTTEQPMSFRYTDAAASIAMATNCQTGFDSPYFPCYIDQLRRRPDGTY